MADKTDHRTAMNRGDVGIEHCETVTVQQNFDRLQIIVEQVLVINLVEGKVFDDALHIEKLHDENTVLLQRFSNTISDRMELFEVEKNTCSINHIELTTKVLRNFQ